MSLIAEQHPSNSEFSGACQYKLINSSILLIYRPRRVILDVCHAWGGYGWHKYTPKAPSIPDTTVNKMRPKRPSWNSLLTKANRPRLFIACRVYPTCVMWFLTRLIPKYITRACSMNFSALFTHPQTKPRTLNTAPPNIFQQVPINAVMWNKG
jgi:hypothetical protein